MNFFNINTLKEIEKRDGIFIKSITGKDLQFVFVELSSGVETFHQHLHEQLGMILEGEIEITINDTKKLCKEGDLYHIPSNVKHGFKVKSENSAKILDVFSPPKEENMI